MLFVLIQQIVKDLFVEKSNSLEIISRSGLETDDLVNETVGLMRQGCDVLLTLEFLFHIC